MKVLLAMVATSLVRKVTEVYMYLECFPASDSIWKHEKGSFI